MAEQLAEQFGYLGLLVASFLAATILPFSSEVAILLMYQLGFNGILILIFATTGNFLGALTNYYAGKLGNRYLLSKYIASDNKNFAKAEKLFKRWGTPILFFSWLPIIGDPLTIVPGILNSRLLPVAFWILLGRSLRYVFVLWFSSLVVTSVNTPDFLNFG